MSTSLFFSVLTCSILLAQPTQSVVRSYESSGQNVAIVYMPVVGYLEVNIKDNLLTVNNTFQHTNSLKPCKLTIDPYEDAILGRIQTLAFERSIVVWGIRSIETIDEIKHTRYTMLLVDPNSCSYKPLRLPSDEVPIDYPTFPPQVQVVPHETYGNAFYVFYQTLQKCAPCQYYPRDSQLTRVDHQIQPRVMGPSKSLHVQAFVDLKGRAHNGYLLVYNYKIGTARLEYLSRNFTVLTKRYLNHTVDVTSIIVKNADRQNVVACWRHSQDQITCERFDSTLANKASYQLEGDSVSILFDKYENAYVSTARKFGGVNVSVYNVSGKVIDKFEFNPVSRFSGRSLRSAADLEVNGFLEEFDNPHDYCFVAKEVPKIVRSNSKAVYSIKCIDVRKYAKIVKI